MEGDTLMDEKILEKALKIYKDRYGYRINLDIDANTLNDIIRGVKDDSKTTTQQSNRTRRPSNR